MKTRLVLVKDVATEYTAVLIEFDDAWELKRLRKLGWDIDEPPKLIVLLHSGGGASACISNFDYPPYDLKERSYKMPVNSTTIQLAWNFKHGEPIEGFPEIFDVRAAKKRFER